MYMDKVKEHLEDLHLLHKLKLLGCSQQDIQRLEAKVGKSFPIAYREFLLWMGRVN